MIDIALAQARKLWPWLWHLSGPEMVEQARAHVKILPPLEGEAMRRAVALELRRWIYQGVGADADLRVIEALEDTREMAEDLPVGVAAEVEAAIGRLQKEVGG